MTVVTCSIHKEPVAGAEHPARMIQEVPDSRRDRQHRPLERRRPDAVGDVHDPGDHRAGERQGFPRGRVVVAARAVERAGDDGAGAGQRGARRFADIVRPQSAHLRACCAARSRTARSTPFRCDQRRARRRRSISRSIAAGSSSRGQTGRKHRVRLRGVEHRRGDAAEFRLQLGFAERPRRIARHVRDQCAHAGPDAVSTVTAPPTHLRIAVRLEPIVGRAPRSAA